MSLQPAPGPTRGLLVMRLRARYSPPRRLGCASQKTRRPRGRRSAGGGEARGARTAERGERPVRTELAETRQRDDAELGESERRARATERQRRERSEPSGARWAAGARRGRRCVSQSLCCLWRGTGLLGTRVGTRFPNPGTVLNVGTRVGTRLRRVANPGTRLRRVPGFWQSVTDL